MKDNYSTFNLFLDRLKSPPKENPSPTSYYESCRQALEVLNFSLQKDCQLLSDLDKEDFLQQLKSALKIEQTKVWATNEQIGKILNHYNILYSELFEYRTQPNDLETILTEPITKDKNEAELIKETFINFWFDEYIKKALSIISNLAVEDIQQVNSQILSAKIFVLCDKKILDLHTLFNYEVFEEMDSGDFRNCFDKNKKPDIAPRYYSTKMNLMIYALSLIKGIDDKFALSNFGIKNYYQMKNRKLPKAKRSIQKQINNILSPALINVTSK